MITEAQRVARNGFIGASDAAAAMGLNAHKTPYDLWLDKTGQQSVPFEGNEFTYWGNVLEPVVADRLAEETGYKLRRHGRTITAKDYPFMGCHLDYKVTALPTVVEIKTGGYFTKDQWGESGSDQVPDNYLIQVQHQMICTGYKQALVAVLLGGQEFRWYQINYDADLAQLIIEKLTAFWQYVVNRVPPPPSNNNDLRGLFPNDDGLSIEADTDVIGWLKELDTAKTMAANVALVIDTLELQIKNFIGVNSAIVDSKGKPLATWKAQTTNRIDTTQLKRDLPDIAETYTKATSSRVLRVK